MEEQKELTHCCSSKKQYWEPLIGILVIFFIALTVFTVVEIRNKIKESRYIGQQFDTKNTIMVSGEGEIFARPDLGIITFSVQSEKQSVPEALADSSQKMNTVINAVKSQGVDEKDLKTTSFAIYPRYEYQGASSSLYPPYPEGKRTLAGYDVSQSLEIKIRNLDKIGVIIQSATDAGANDVGNLQLTIDKQDDLQKQARQQAIDQAKAKAKDLASQLGVHLVGIVSFNENNVLPMYRFDMAAGKGGGPVPAPEIQPGENKISVNVNITYEIN